MLEVPLFANIVNDVSHSLLFAVTLGRIDLESELDVATFFFIFDDEVFAVLGQGLQAD